MLGVSVSVLLGGGRFPCRPPSIHFKQMAVTWTVRKRLRQISISSAVKAGPSWLPWPRMAVPLAARMRAGIGVRLDLVERELEGKRCV